MRGRENSESDDQFKRDHMLPLRDRRISQNSTPLDLVIIILQTSLAQAETITINKFIDLCC